MQYTDNLKRGRPWSAYHPTALRLPCLKSTESPPFYFSFFFFAADCLHISCDIVCGVSMFVCLCGEGGKYFNLEPDGKQVGAFLRISTKVQIFLTFILPSSTYHRVTFLQVNKFHCCQILLILPEDLKYSTAVHASEWNASPLAPVS